MKRNKLGLKGCCGPRSTEQELYELVSVQGKHGKEQLMIAKETKPVVVHVS